MLLAIAALAGVALVAARALGAPRGASGLILGFAAALVVAAGLLPQGHPWRIDVTLLLRVGVWIALAAVPVSIYAAWLARMRRRAGGVAAGGGPPAAARGLVQFPQDAALVAETGAALAADADAALAGPRLSLGWRGEGGGLEGHLRMRLHGEVAEVEMLRVAPAARRRGVGRRLVGAAEVEAAALGARRIGALVGDWQAPEFFARLGFLGGEPHGLGGGTARRWMEKAL